MAQGKMGVSLAGKKMLHERGLLSKGGKIAGKQKLAKAILASKGSAPKKQ
jgi:hypothetical protein